MLGHACRRPAGAVHAAGHLWVAATAPSIAAAAQCTIAAGLVHAGAAPTPTPMRNTMAAEDQLRLVGEGRQSSTGLCPAAHDRRCSCLRLAVLAGELEGARHPEAVEPRREASQRAGAVAREHTTHCPAILSRLTAAQYRLDVSDDAGTRLSSRRERGAAANLGEAAGEGEWGRRARLIAAPRAFSLRDHRNGLGRHNMSHCKVSRSMEKQLLP